LWERDRVVDVRLAGLLNGPGHKYLGKKSKCEMTAGPRKFLLKRCRGVKICSGKRASKCPAHHDDGTNTNESRGQMEAGQG